MSPPPIAVNVSVASKHCARELFDDEFWPPGSLAEDGSDEFELVDDLHWRLASAVSSAHVPVRVSAGLAAISIAKGFKRRCENASPAPKQKRSNWPGRVKVDMGCDEEGVACVELIYVDELC